MGYGLTFLSDFLHNKKNKEFCKYNTFLSVCLLFIKSMPRREEKRVGVPSTT